MAGLDFRDRLGLGLILLAAGSVWALVPASPAPEEKRPSGGLSWNRPYTVKGSRYVPMSRPEAVRYRQEGMASWYGMETYRRRGGKTTASGERFHPGYLSAAHRTLPLPTWVQVTNLENGRALVVRVNDRGPFASDFNPRSEQRIIDLSAAAAKKLGFYRRGLARVRVESMG